MPKGVEPEGIEPSSTDCDTIVLPLNDGPSTEISSVESEGVEPSFPECKSGVFPLDHNPMRDHYSGPPRSRTETSCSSGRRADQLRQGPVPKALRDEGRALGWTTRGLLKAVCRPLVRTRLSKTGCERPHARRDESRTRVVWLPDLDLNQDLPGQSRSSSPLNDLAILCSRRLPTVESNHDLPGQSRAPSTTGPVGTTYFAAR